MPRFAVGQSIRTREPVVSVDAGLEPGTHRFQLEVTTSDGRTSRPDVADVTVTRLRLDEPTRPPTDPVIPE